MFESKTILVVGASSVLGAELIQRLQAAGAKLILTTRSGQSAVARTGVDEVHSLDLTSEASIASFVNSLGDRVLDGVVVAAGVVAFGSAAETPIEITENLMRVNALGAISLITKLHSNLKAGTEAFVLTLSGKIAEVPTAGMAAYSASKTSLFAWVTAVAREFRRDGIRVIDARPGHTETGLASRAIFGTTPNFGQGLTSTAVADRIMRALFDGEKDLPSSEF